MITTGILRMLKEIILTLEKGESQAEMTTHHHVIKLTAEETSTPLTEAEVLNLKDPE